MFPWGLSLAYHYSLSFLCSRFASLCKEYNRVLDEQEEAKAKELSERSSPAMYPSRLHEHVESQSKAELDLAISCHILAYLASPELRLRALAFS